MTKVLVATILGLSVITSAQAQVAPGTTGGRAGGPNQSQAVVPSDATGGRAGGPSQSGFDKKAKTEKKMKSEKKTDKH